MKVYLDFVFFINFFFDFLLLFGTKKILKKQTSLIRLLFGSTVGSLSTFFLFFHIHSFSLFLFKIFLSCLMIFVTFGKRDFFRCIGYFYLLSVILGGSLYLLGITTTYDQQGMVFVKNGIQLNLLFFFLFAPIILFSYLFEHVKYRRMYENVYPVEIDFGSKQYKLEGMLDTGNQLTDPFKKRAVILVNCDIKVAKSKFIYVPYKALNTSGVIPCFLPDRVIVKDKIFTNCLVGMSKEKFCLGGVQCILPNQFKEDL